MELNKVEEVLEDFKKGKLAIVVDDKERENEGDLIIPASCVTPEIINFMAKYARGLICVAITSKRAKELGLTPMVGKNTSLKGTPFTVSVDAKSNTTTGISAYDRAQTIKVLIDPKTKEDDFSGRLSQVGGVLSCGSCLRDDGRRWKNGKASPAFVLCQGTSS